MPERSDQIRAFVAACLPVGVLARIKAEQKRLASKMETDAVRWTRSEQLHLTLKFYGNVAGDRVDSLKAALHRAVKGVRPISLTADGLGCFPSSQQPRVLWVGLDGDLEELKQLQARVEVESAAFGNHSEDREFHPHLTLGRVKTPGAGARRIGEVIRSSEVGPMGSWEVRQITLIQSRLSPAGSTYTALAEIPLAGFL
jgi:RNA 2',3'-cyclic 3'-phosphodiesterase